MLKQPVCKAGCCSNCNNQLIKYRKARRIFLDENGNVVKTSTWAIRTFSEKSDLYQNIERSDYF